jgi:hypothetical protein
MQNHAKWPKAPSFIAEAIDWLMRMNMLENINFFSLKNKG